MFSVYFINIIISLQRSSTIVRERSKCYNRWEFYVNISLKDVLFYFQLLQHYSDKAY